MRSGYTGHIAPTEWRWVILVASGLVLLAFAPYLWLLIIGVSGSQWQFMGALHVHQDGATNLAQVLQGREGLWLTRFLHTPEPHSGTFIGVLYAVLGQIARLGSLSTDLVYHVARVGASLFMYLALYQLAATIWMRVRTRRIFFIFAALGSGLGWLLSPLTGETAYLDVIGPYAAPQAYPFYSSLANVHFPLAIACLALMTSVMVMIFRPGESQAPSVENGGLIAFSTSLALVIIYPIAFIPILLAFFIGILIRWYRQREITTPELRWLLWFSVPALPVLAYDIAVLRYNPIVAEIWAQENAIAPPSPLVFALSLGLTLLIALPGMYRAIRRFEPDGDQFMVVWLLVIVLLVYLPTTVQQRFVAGIMIPLSYFATRSLEDFWFDHISRPWRYRMLAALIPVLAAGHLLVLFLPIRPISSGDLNDETGLLLQRDYVDTFAFLEALSRPNDVVLASPVTSLWLPAWAGMQVVYGHPTDTLQAAEKRRAVRAWYSEEDVANCDDLLQGAFSFERDYRVNYVLVGPQENDLGRTVCTELLEPLVRIGSVRVYTYDVRPLTSSR